MESFHVRSAHPVLNKFNIGPVILRISPIHGRGLLATKNLRHGDFVGECEGDRPLKDVIDNRAEQYSRHGVNRYLITASGDGTGSGSSSLELVGFIVIDGTVNGNVTWFINHSFSPTRYTQEMEHGSLSLLSIFLRCNVHAST